jgi:hypothetical protein
MTHQNESNELNAAVQLLAHHGFEGMANAMQVLFNEAMKIERSEYLNAAPYQRTDERRRMPTVSRTRPSIPDLGN